MRRRLERRILVLDVLRAVFGDQRRAQNAHAAGPILAG
jgi:hypothetical protein